MVHPAAPHLRDHPFDLDPQRQTELNMLIDPEAMELVEKYGLSWGRMRVILRIQRKQKNQTNQRIKPLIQLKRCYNLSSSEVLCFL